MIQINYVRYRTFILYRPPTTTSCVGRKNGRIARPVRELCARERPASGIRGSRGQFKHVSGPLASRPDRYRMLRLCTDEVERYV